MARTVFKTNEGEKKQNLSDLDNHPRQNFNISPGTPTLSPYIDLLITEQVERLTNPAQVQLIASKIANYVMDLDFKILITLCGNVTVEMEPARGFVSCFFTESLLTCAFQMFLLPISIP